MYIELVEPYIGKSSPLVAQPIDKSAIRKFAIGAFESDPVYYDEEYAKSTPHKAIIAPPTFILSLNFPLITPLQGAVLPIRGAIHASQRFEYFKPIKAGDVVYCRNTIVNAFEKTGRDGLMLFIEYEYAALDSDGEKYCVGYITLVYKESLLENSNPEFRKPLLAQIPDSGWLECLEPTRPDELIAGHEIGPLALPQTGRVAIAMWAGGSNDYNPIHFDENSAKASGMDGCIAHGMLVASLQTTLVNHWLGEVGRISDTKFKFLSPVYPDDRLFSAGKVEQAERTGEGVLVKVKFFIKNEQAKAVLESDYSIVFEHTGKARNQAETE